jgi:hypothetical protein
MEVGNMSERKRAAKAKDNAREAVVLLEQARALIVEDDAGQPAIEHVCAAIHEAEGRANVLEDWYLRTYSPAEEKLPR